MAFTVRVQGKTGPVDGRAMADCGQGILQDAPRPAMHVHVATRDERQLQAPTFFTQARQLLLLSPVGK